MAHKPFYLVISRFPTDAGGIHYYSTIRLRRNKRIVIGELEIPKTFSRKAAIESTRTAFNRFFDYGCWGYMPFEAAVKIKKGVFQP